MHLFDGSSEGNCVRGGYSALGSVRPSRRLRSMRREVSGRGLDLGKLGSRGDSLESDLVSSLAAWAGGDGPPIRFAFEARAVLCKIGHSMIVDYCLSL